MCKGFEKSKSKIKEICTKFLRNRNKGAQSQFCFMGFIV